MNLIQTPRTLLSLTFLLGCTVPPAAHGPFLPPTATLKKSSGEVSVLAGGDAMGAGDARFTAVISDRVAFDLGGQFGILAQGVNAGMWLRTGKNKRGRTAAFRLGLGGGVGYSASTMVLLNAYGGSAIFDSDNPASYGASTFHGQFGRQRPNNQGKLSVLVGFGFTIRSATDSNVGDDLPVYGHMDFSVRYDRPSKWFYGFGVQGFVPVPAATFGRRF